MKYQIFISEEKTFKRVKRWLENKPERWNQVEFSIKLKSGEGWIIQTNLLPKNMDGLIIFQVKRKEVKL